MRTNRAIFLGSFNPPHKGHINALKSVIEWFKKYKLKEPFDKIHIIPCWQNPNKEFVTPYLDRYQMCKLEFASLCDDCIVDDIEGKRHPKYTYELIDYFNSNQDSYIKDDFWWIITEETLLELINGKWKESERLIKENRFIILTKGPMNIDIINYFHDKELKNHVWVLLDSDCNIHSTQLREMIKNNKDVYPYINLGTQVYINQNKIYK